MDGRQFDRWTRLFAAAGGRRRFLKGLGAAAAVATVGGRTAPLRAQVECPGGCRRGEQCVDGACIRPCQDAGECRRGSDDACIGAQCIDGACVEFVVDCAPGYVCCRNGECCPAPCSTSDDCATLDACAVGVCGEDGLCAFARRDPCVTCADDAGCAATSPGAICCAGACVRPCPEGFVLGKGCECLAPGGDASTLVVVDDATGRSNVSPAPPTVGRTEAGADGVEEINVEVVDSPPSVVTTGE